MDIYEKPENEDFNYFTSDDILVSVTRNEFLQDFVADRMSELRKEVIAGKETTIHDLVFRIAKDVVDWSKTTIDQTINAKALLLNCWLTVNYGEKTVVKLNGIDTDTDTIVDNDELFESLESEIYLGMNYVLKVEHGN